MNDTPPTATPPFPTAGEDARWPGWIGGTAIAFAVLMLGVSCCQVLGVFGSQLVPMGDLKFPRAPGLLSGSMIADMFLTLVLAAVLLSGGVGTLRRRQSGIRALRRFALLRLALVLPLLVVSIASVRPAVRWSAEIARVVVEWKERQGAQVTEAEREATRQQEPTAFQMAMSIAYPVAGGAYPLFLLLFLRRPDVGREVERWDA